MAISGGDGSIILSTTIDTSGVSKGLTSIKNKFSALKDQKATLSTLTQAIKDQQYVLDKLNVEYAEYVAKGKQTSTQAKALKAQINDLTAEMKEMEAAATTLGAKSTTSFSKMKSSLATLVSYFIGIQTVFAAIRFSGAAAEFATQTEASVQRLVDIYGSASDSVGDFIDSNARALGMSKSAAASFASVYGNLFSVWADQKTNAELSNKYLNMTAVVASKTGRTVEDVQERIRSGLLGNTEAIEDLGIFVNVKTIEMTDAFQRMANGQSWEQLDAYTQQQIRTMAILEQATSKYGDEVAETSTTIRNQFNAAYQDFQNTWGQVVNTVLLPVLRVLTQIFDIATKGLNALMGKSGQILGDVQKQETSTNETTKNINKQTKAQKKLNKEMKKTLAGFDDIQKLSSGAADGTEDAAANAAASAGITTTGDTGLDGSGNANAISANLAAIMAVIGGALVAIGVMLLFSGQVAWGIGFIIAGAGIFSVSMAALSDSDTKGTISTNLLAIMAIAGIALIGIGLILLFSGDIPWGIGFIIAGAAALSVTAMSGSKQEIAGAIKEFLKNNGELIVGVATALVVLGVILMLSGVALPLGMGLIVAGSVVLAKSETEDKEKVKNSISDFLKQNGELIVGVALAMVILGVVLMMSGVALPLGMGLIVAGSVVLAKSETEDKEKVKNSISDFINQNGELIVGVALAMLILGFVLFLSGVGIPLALGLVIAGGVILATSQEEDKEKVKNSISDFIKNNQELIVGVAVAVLIIGIVLLISGVGIPLALGMIVFAGGVLAKSENEEVDKVKNSITNFLKENSGLIIGISIAILVLGIILCVCGIITPLSIGMIVFGAAGLVTEVALNWNTIVTKIKTFLFENSTLLTLISGGLLILGIILCVTGVMLPLGIALIAAGAVGLVTITALNWNSIVDWVKGAWDAVKLFWNENIAPVFTITWWKNLAIKCGNGLIAGFEGAINGIIQAFEDMINWIVGGLNKISFTNPLNGETIGINIPKVDLKSVKIPRLAKGAVIPGNREFLAILGDQPAGQTNIEAPLQTIVDAFNIALSQNGNNVGMSEVVLEIDGREFGRAVLEQGNRESRRVGTRLVIG